VTTIQQQQPLDSSARWQQAVMGMAMFMKSFYVYEIVNKKFFLQK